MDQADEVAALKQQVERLKGNVSAARTELKAFRIAFSAILKALRDRDAETADRITTTLLRELNILEGMGESDLLQALRHLHEAAAPKET